MEKLERELLREKMMRVLTKLRFGSGLKEREKKVLEMWNNGDGMSQRAIGEEIGVTGARVGQIIEKTKDKIRKREIMAEEAVDLISDVVFTESEVREAFGKSGLKGWEDLQNNLWEQKK